MTVAPSMNIKFYFQHNECQKKFDIRRNTFIQVVHKCAIYDMAQMNVHLRMSLHSTLVQNEIILFINYFLDYFDLLYTKLLKKVQKIAFLNQLGKITNFWENRQKCINNITIE